LPTDEEWSVAVGLDEPGGGTPRDKQQQIKGVYPWGTQWPPPSGAGNYGSSLKVDDYEYTSTVGSFNANRYGLYDMGGNVWQWCEDWYDTDQKYRVSRGGAWHNFDPVGLLSSARGVAAPGARGNNDGFRVVLADGSSRWAGLD
jgi:formylglycine-generating enzyme required for sulfatase activity